MTGHAAAAALAAGLTVALAARPLRRAPAAAAVVAAGALVVTGLAAVGPRVLPGEALLVLHEGREDVIQQILWQREPWLGGTWPTAAPLRETAFIHLLAATAAATALVAFALARPGAWRGRWPWGALALVPWATSALAVHAPLADEPASPIALALLAGAAAWASAGTDRRRQAAAAIAVAAWLYALIPLRIEPLAFGVTAALAWWSGTTGEAPDRRWPWRLLAILALSSAGLYAIDALRPLLSAASGVRLAPGDLTSSRHLGSLRLPVDLFLLGGVGLAGLTLVGIVEAARRPAWWGVALVTVLLARTYALAGHLGAAPLETLRYHADLLGGLGLLLVLAGEALARHPLGRALLVVAAIEAVLPPLADPLPRAGRWATLDTTQQHAARFLVAAVEQAPTCTLVGRLADAPPQPNVPQDALTFTLRSARYGARIAAGSPHLDAEADALWRDGGPGCVRQVVGPDCHLLGVRCDGLRGRVLLERVVDAPEHNTHHGAHTRPMRLQVWGD